MSAAGAGLVAADHPLWRVHRERVLLLGAGRALLLQLAHPLVAAGVAEHSRFADDPLGRLRRTLAPMYALVFGDGAARAAAAGRLAAVHAPVQGRLRAPVGPFPAGTPYAASDPALRLWVHATLIDSALVTHARFARPLGAAERARYYAGTLALGRAVGVPGARLPPTLDAFETWMAEAVAADTLTVGPDARAAAAAVLRPAAPLLRLPMPLVRLVTAGLLPPRLRAAYALPWSPARAALFRGLAAAIRVVHPALPAVLRVVPEARRAERGARAASPAPTPAAGT